MKKFESALDTVIKQFGKKIITEKRFVSVLADYNAFYTTPVIRDIIIRCINDGFLQDLYKIYSRKSIFGGTKKKYNDVRKCVTQYKSSLKNGYNKHIHETVIDLIVSIIVDGYSSILVKSIQTNNIQTSNKTRFHFRKKYLLGAFLALFCAFSSYYCYWLNQAIRHNAEIENERRTKEVSLSFKGIALGNGIDGDNNTIGWEFKWMERDIYIEEGPRHETYWDNGQVELLECKYFTFSTFLNGIRVKGAVRAYQGSVYEIELDRTKVENIETDYIKKYGEPSTDTLSLRLSFFNASPRVLYWKFKNGTISITHSTIRYYLPETLKKVEMYQKEKEEETRQKVLQREREDSIREAEEIKEKMEKEKAAKIKQLNDI